MREKAVCTTCQVKMKHCAALPSTGHNRLVHIIHLLTQTASCHGNLQM